MSIKKLTPQKEKFAQSVASGMNQSDAYRSAYNVRKGTKLTSVNVSASQLMADPNVSQRVADLRKPIVEAAQMTLAGHLTDLFTLREAAVKTNQLGAAITAEVARGKASGLYTEKHDITGTLTYERIERVIVRPKK